MSADGTQGPDPGAQGGPVGAEGPAGPPRAAVDTVDLLRPALTLWSYRRLIAVVAGVATMAAILYALSIGPRFTGVAQVLIGGREANVIDIEGVATRLQADEETVASEIGVILSNAVLERAVRALALTEDPVYAPEADPDRGLPGALAGPLRRVGILSSEPAAAGAVDRAVGALRRSLEVRPRGGSFIVDVAATADAPRKAALVANAVANAYLLGRLEEAAGEADSAAAFLSDQLDAMRAEIEEAEARMARLRGERLDAFGESAETTRARLARVADRLAAAQADRAEAEARAALADRADGLASLPEVLESDLVDRLQERIAELRAAEASLLTRAGERHPEVIALRAEIADRTARRDDEIARIAEGVRREFERARDAEASLRALTRDLERRLVDGDRETARLAALGADLDAARALYGSFLTRFREVSETASLLQADARIVSDARPPERGSGPSRRLIVALAALLGLALGALAALLAEAVDQTVRTGAQVERLFSVPHLGSLPRARRLRGQRPWQAPDAEGKGDRRLVESLRDLRAAVLLDGRAAVLGVTSAASDEGKSTAAALLAWSLSEIGRRVILVEADLRSPSLARLVAPEAEIGLSHVLRGEAALAGAVVGARAGFDLLPAGRADASAANLLLSAQLGEAFDALRERYDHVVVDLPPMSPVNDVPILGPELDAAILVVRWNATERSAVRGALAKLGARGIRVMGAVLTMVETASATEDEGRRMRSKYYARG